MNIIPVADTYNQQFNVVLNGQSCQINVYQKSTGLYLDLLQAGIPICTGILCLNLNRIVRVAYLGFSGDLMWQDTQGTNDPSSPGLGTRFLLCYLTAGDVEQLTDEDVGPDQDNDDYGLVD